MVVNGKMIPMPQKTPQESIESACVERVGGVYFTTADELDEYVEKTRNEKYLRKQKMRVASSAILIFVDNARGVTHFLSSKTSSPPFVISS